MDDERLSGPEKNKILLAELSHTLELWKEETVVYSGVAAGDQREEKAVEKRFLDAPSRLAAGLTADQAAAQKSFFTQEERQSYIDKNVPPLYVAMRIILEEGRKCAQYCQSGSVTFEARNYPADEPPGRLVYESDVNFARSSYHLNIDQQLLNMVLGVIEARKTAAITTEKVESVAPAVDPTDPQSETIIIENGGRFIRTTIPTGHPWITAEEERDEVVSAAGKVTVSNRLSFCFNLPPIGEFGPAVASSPTKSTDPYYAPPQTTPAGTPVLATQSADTRQDTGFVTPGYDPKKGWLDDPLKHLKPLSADADWTATDQTKAHKPEKWDPDRDN